MKKLSAKKTEEKEGKNFLGLNRKLLSLSLLSIFLILTFSFLASSATQLLCLGKGEKVKFSECNPAMSDYTCSATICNICVTLCSNGAYGPASLNACNGQDLTCDSSSSLDQEPPVLTISNPVENTIFNSRSFNLILNTDEKADVSYASALDIRGVWKTVCKNCMSYTGKRSFTDGPNNLTFRAIDKAGNIFYLNRSFIVDSKKPKINKIGPKGFTSGLFELEFRELNPISLNFYYGNALSGQTFYQVNINSECNNIGERYYCDILRNLNNYNSEEIQFYFNLTDVAGSSSSSKISKLNVDTLFPIINSIFNETIGRKVTLIINITEENFESALYRDNSALIPSWKTLCTSLKDNICKKTITLTPGAHSLDIQANDEAGNSVAQPLIINVV